MAWRSVALREILAQKGKKIRVDPGKQYKQITIRLWGKGVFLRGLCDGSEIAAESQVEANAGDFLVSKIDARHGAFGLVPDELDGAVVSSDFPCFAVNRSLVEARYLDWFSKTDAFVSLCKQSSVGSTNRVRLKESHFLSLEIPLPSLQEQRAIARRLDEASRGVQKLAEFTVRMTNELHALVFSLHKDLAEPEPVQFGELVELDERQAPVESDDEFPQLGIRSFGNGLFFKDAVKGSETSYKNFNQVYQGALIVSQPKGWEGAVAVATNDHEGWFVSPEYRTFRCKEGKLHPSYLAALIVTPWFQYELSRMTKGQGARRERLRPEMLTGLKLRMPNLERQTAALEIIEEARRAAALVGSRTKDVESLIPAMLHDIFERVTEESKKVQPVSGVFISPRGLQSLGVDTPFKEAVLVGAIVKKFHADGDQPLGNFRLQKAVYFARRFMGERALDQKFLRKAAGPYNPSMRYSGGIKIAKDKNWIGRANGRFGEGSVLGSRAAEMNEWIEKYQFGHAAAWVLDKFKFRRNDQWELLATVDYAMLALEHEGAQATPTGILTYIKNDDEWRPKVENLQLSEAVIQNAIIEIQSLFGDTVAV